jgi:broad specificity phosphatase PhoE
MKHLYFVRHGESVMNTQLLSSGQTDTPLTKRGINQAKATGKKIKEENISFDAILCSPLQRAHSTAGYIAGEIDYPVESVEVYNDLQERFFGDLEGKNMTDDFGITLEQYYESPTLADKVPHIEKLAELHKRAEEVVEYLKSRPEDCVLVVSHGALLRSVQRVISNKPFDSVLQLTDNATLLKLI